MRSSARPSSRSAIALTALAALALAGCSASSPGNGDAGSGALPDTVVIDTTSPTGANQIAKVGGFLDERFGALDIEVDYTQLGTSSQMLEGIASGNLDFTDIGYPGLPTGAAANVDFRVIGEASSGGGDAVYAVPDGPQTVEDLEGATVAAAKGSSGWALLIRALDEAGLTSSDLEIIDLQPDEAQNAFLTGQVDAWAIWSGQATQIDESNSTLLTSGEELGLIPGAGVTHTANATNDELLAAYLGARQDAVDWFAEDPEAVIEAIAEDRDMASELVSEYFEFSAPLNAPLSDELIEDYQRVADLFYAEGEIAGEVDIADLVSTDAFDRAGL